MKDHTEVVIVGGGPIGIELAVAFRNSSIDCQIIEAGCLGQTMSWWAPQTRWFSSNERISIAGVPLMTLDGSKATREEYLTYLRSVASQFQLSIRSHEKVVKVDRIENDGFHVTSQSSLGQATQVQSTLGQTVTTCDKVVLAIGGTDHPRKPGIPGQDLPHVDGYLREPHRYFGRRVLIIGGRNSAVEAALRLHHAGADVEICYRGAGLPVESIKYWLTPEILGLIEAGRIVSHFDANVIRIDPGLVTIERMSDQSTYQIPIDDVLSLVGYEQDKSLFQTAGIELVDEIERPAHDMETMETNVPGIYVAGTAVAGTQSSKYKTFLENCHQHVDKIVADISGRQAKVSAKVYDKQIQSQPES